MGKLPCCIVDDVRKGSWTAEEDQKLIAYVQKHGEGGWRSLPVKADLQRCGKSCRLRWTNYLRPGIKRGSFTPQEEEMIIKLHAQLGNRWAAIARQLPERTDNEIKNYWNAQIKKRLLANGIDPVTHKPAVLGCDGQDSPSEADQPAEQPPLSKLKRSSAKEVLNKLAARFTTLQSLDSIKSRIRFGLLRPPSDSDGSNGDHTADIMDYLYYSDSASDGQEHSSLPENSSITASGQPLNQMADTLLAWVADDVSPPQQSVAPVNDDGVSDGNRDVGSTWFSDFEFIEDLLALPEVEEEVGRSCQIVPVRGSD